MGVFSNKSILDVQNYWNKRPCNIKHSSKNVGSKEYFDEVEARKYFVEPHIPAFADFNSYKDKKVLEIGCGIGTDTISFARAGANVTAVDLSSESLSIAKKRADVFGHDVKFYQADAENLSETVPVEKYDLVYSFGVIHHTPNPEKTVKEIKKYLGKNSLLKIMVYHRRSWKVFCILLKKFRFTKIDQCIAESSEAQSGCPVTYSYTKKSINKLLSGFEILSIDIDHIFKYKIKDYKEYRYKKVWYFKIIPQFMFRIIEKKLGWHLCITARLKTENERT
ncbi:MAG: class I SAM-dependent methyltransferase [Defluviitaleaceae bacterium]|nr:class I SAM-dependent methyltransferase [Defluviitaleaceae bacterium]